MKVLVTGAFSTGKTSTIGALQRASTLSQSIVVVSDLARDCPLPLHESQDARSTQWLICHQVATELAAAAKNAAIVICDRGIPDILSHWRDVSAEPSVGLQEALALAGAWMRTYDRVFLSTIDDTIAPAADGLRSVDPFYRQRMQERLLEVLSDLDVAPTHLPLGLENRIDFIQSRL